LGTFFGILHLMAGSEGSGKPWKDIVQARVRKWGTRQPLKLSEFMPDLYGRDGRPVREGETESNPAGVLNAHRILNFPERRGLEGNHSAYEAVSEEFDQSLATISYVRSVVFPYGSEITREGLVDVASTLNFLSDFLVLRADNPVRNGEIPTDIAGVTKIARGFMKPYDKFTLAKIGERYTGIAPVQPDFFVDENAFMSYIVKNNLLLTQENRAHGKACPAPLPVIAKVERVFLTEQAPGMEDAGERLGLSVEEIMRARNFGRALRRALLEQQVSDFMRDLPQRLPHMPTYVRSGIQRERMQTEKIITNNVAIANKALGRR
jgi:hypothetical protein